jgi:hypothetical protein
MAVPVAYDLDVQSFVVHDLLPPEDFAQLAIEKDKFINTGDGAITIEKDGTITKNTDVSANGIFGGAFFNFTGDIERYREFLPPKLMDAIYATKKILVDRGLKNPDPTSVRCYRNNKTITWHTHTPVRPMPNNKFWMTLYYLHPNWDVKYKGDLHVSWLDAAPTSRIVPCTSNTVVGHVGYFGHQVKELIKGYEGNRDLLTILWECE